MSLGRLLGPAAWGLALCLCLARPLAAETPQEAAQELRQRLDQALDQHEENRRALEALNQEAARLEAQTIEAQGQAHQLSEQELELGRQLPLVSQQEKELSPLVARQRQVMARHLRALYLFGPDAGPALLASSHDFNDVLARSQYLAWLLEADQRQLTELSQRSRQLGQVRAQLLASQEQALSLEKQLAQNRQHLEDLRQQGQEAQARLRQRQAALEESLKALREAEERLARTFALATPPPRPAGPPPGPGPILEAKGSLAPPVEGRALEAQPAQHGVLLQAGPGALVRAVWEGTVLYASHMPAYGQVVVVDHGERVHMVLAHLGRLSVEAGQMVKAGQALGAVDDSGQLYLEVRRGSKPENPLDWLRLGP